MRIEDFQDKHSGRMAFVVGSGPSLHFQDLSRLKEHIVFSVNSSILKVPDCDYFVSDDEGVTHWNYYKDTARKSNCVKLLYKNKLEKHCSLFPKEKVCLFAHKTWYDPTTKTYPEGGLNMTKDASLPIIGARTSLATAIHLAYIMGCNPIVMLGADCCFRDNKRYYWQYPGERQAFQIGKPNIVSGANKGRVDGKAVDNHCVDFLEYWRQFAVANAGKANIIYASEGGILKCFPTKTLAEVLGERQ